MNALAPQAAEAARTAARQIKSAVERFGWTEEDCEQQAVVEILDRAARGAMPVSDNPVYLIVVLKRAIYKAAKPADDVPTVHDQILARVADVGGAAADVELRDMIECAPFTIRLYLRAWVLDGLDWDGVRALYGWTNYRLAQVKRFAELWLIDQYDGQRKGDAERGIALT